MITTTPQLSYNVQRDRWTLVEDYFNKKNHLLVMTGFSSDLASIPRILWFALAPYELSTSAPLVHDYLYRNAGKPTEIHRDDYYDFILIGYKVFSRKESDRIFFKIMIDEGVSWIKAKIAYYAVRIFAGVVWKKRLKKNL